MSEISEHLAEAQERLRDRVVDDLFRGVEDPLLTVTQAAELLQISPYMVRQWARERKIPAIRMGERYWRFRRSSLDAWISERERAAR